MCAQEKKEGNEPIPEHRPLEVQKHHVFNITHQYSIQQRYQKHLLFEDMESTQRELEDTSKASFDFRSQLILHANGHYQPPV